MDKDIVLGILTVAGIIAGGSVGGVCTIIAARTGYKFTEMKRHIANLCDQITAYHSLEELYAKEIEKLDRARGTARTIQIKMRDQVEDQDLPRPAMTANEADKIKQRWS
ncbi:MAG: hypothetical protein ACLQUZ_18960 [Rhizomicrobium sp.]